MKKGKKSSFVSLVKCDVLQGIINYWYYYAIALVVVFFAMSDYRISVINGSDGISFTFMDCIKAFFMGVEDSVDNSSYQFPTIFMSYLLIPFIVVSFYPANDFLERAKIIFIRTGKRAMWWYSKCLWLVLGVMLYMMIFYLGLAVFTGMSGEMSFELLNGADGVAMNFFDRILQFIVLPIATTIALGLGQMVISVAASPLFGVLVQIIQLTLSMLYISPFLPGNFYMYKRSSFFREDGVEMTTAFVVCLVISLISIVIGKIIVEKKDIL